MCENTDTLYVQSDASITRQKFFCATRNTVRHHFDTPNTRRAAQIGKKTSK